MVISEFSEDKDILAIPWGKMENLAGQLTRHWSSLDAKAKSLLGGILVKRLMIPENTLSVNHLQDLSVSENFPL
ncbi:MAG: hypothetical protein ABI618_04855 [Nitrospirota bacterium]